MTNGSGCSVAFVVAVFVVFIAVGSPAQWANSWPGSGDPGSSPPSLRARSHDQTDVLLTSLDTVIHDREICRAKDSVLEDSAESGRS